MVSRQTKLDRFIAAFKDEADLRKAVTGLLERMPNTSNVRLTHGSEERGKDIVFHWTGPFDQRLLVSCVIKNGKIDGSAESARGARTVYIQAEQTLDTPIANPANGSEERVAQVYIISPHECSISTVDSIKAKLQTRQGQVMFLCGRELMDKFEKHYPEFVLFQPELYGSYIEELEKGLDSDSAVMNALFRHGFLSSTKTLSTVYVRPTFSRELRRFKMRMPRVTPDIFSRRTTSEKAVALARTLRDFGRLVGAITMPGNDGRSLQQAFYGLAEDVEHGWKAAFEIYRAGRHKNEQAKPVMLHLNGAGSLRARSKELLDNSRPIIEMFELNITLANNLSDDKFDSDEHALESPKFLNYCQVESVSRQVPAIVRAIDPPTKTLELPETLTALIKENLLITGPAGFGKTSFCKWETLRDLKRLKEGQSSVVPIYFPLYQVAQGELDSFESVFIKTPELIALWRQRRRSGSPHTRRFRLYLDGLDEVPSADRQRNILELVYNAKKADPSLEIIVTGREHVVGSHLNSLLRVRVRDFDQRQIRELAMHWFDHDKQLLREFFEELKKVPTLRPLMCVPLLATLILAVYRNSKTLPESRANLYEMFVNLLAGGWDMAKNLARPTDFGPAPKLIVLTRLASILHIARRRDSSQDDFQNAIKDTLSGLQGKWQRLLEEILQDGLLIPTGATYAFAHLSLQEYLVAKEMLQPSGRRFRSALESFLSGDDWWQEVVCFYGSEQEFVESQ